MNFQKKELISGKRFLYHLNVRAILHKFINQALLMFLTESKVKYFIIILTLSHFTSPYFIYQKLVKLLVNKSLVEPVLYSNILFFIHRCR